MPIDVPDRFERDWDRPVDGGPVRFAIVGLGWFGRDVAIPAIADSEYCETTVVVSGDAGKAGDVRDDNETVAHGLTYDEFQAGEAADAYDAVYIVTPNALHLPYAETAAELGKDVLCEKPLEATAERAKSIVEACEDGDVALMTAYRMQTTRSIRWVRRQVQDGLIGDPVQVAGEFSYRMLAHGGDPNQWRIDKNLAGGGALMDIGVYPLNTSRYVLDADPIAVSATTHATEPAFEGVDEHVSFQLEFPDAVTANCTASFGAYHTHRFSILGTDGRIVVEPVFDVDADREITIETDYGRTTVDAGEPSEMVEEFDFFAAHVLGEDPIGPDGRHGLTDLQITEAIYESSERGERIDL